MPNSTRPAPMEPFELPVNSVNRLPTEPSVVGLGAREWLAKSLEAVLISGLELVRQAIAATASESHRSDDTPSRERARQFEAAVASRIQAAIARWYEGSFLLLEAAHRGGGSTDIETIEARLGVDSGRGVSILADELFHELNSGALPMPAVDPALDGGAGLRWYCLCAIGALELELNVRGFQPILRSVVLEAWPGLIRESLRLLAGDATPERPSGEFNAAASSPMATTGLAALDGAFDQVRFPGPLPVALEPLVMRLRMPFAVLASLDAGFLQDEERSLRRLLEALCDAARLAPQQLAPHSPLLKQLEVAVRAIEVMAQQAQTRARVLHGQLEREVKRASQGVSTVLSRLERERDQLRLAAADNNRRDLRRRPSRERELQVTDAVRGLLRRKIENRPLPDTVTDFLHEVWVRHLRTAVLRDGERSPQFHRALGVVDDLVWTLDTTQKDTSRSQLIKRIPDIVQTFSVGAQSVGLSEGEMQPFMDELFMAHLRGMQRSSSRASEIESLPRLQPTPAPAIPLVRILREIAVDDCPLDARAIAASEEDIDRVQPGCWLQLHSGTQHSRLKVAWINGDRSVVLLVREGDRKAVSLRGRDLQERLLRRSAMLLV